MNITPEVRQAWLEALFEVYKMDAAEPGRFSDMRATLDGWQRQIRQAPIDGEPPIPPPSTDPLARIRSAPSQWAKWLDQTSAESEALIAGGYITRADKNLLNNWWGLNGVKGARLPDGRYRYYTYPDGVETENIDDGSADAATAAASGQAIPGPNLPGVD